MLKFGLTAMLLGGIIVSMAHDASAGVMMDDENARLASREVNQQFCQDLIASVEKQTQVLEDIREMLGGGNFQIPDLNGPCAEGNYEVIDDTKRASRVPYLGHSELCDQHLDEGWYRFKLDGNNAEMVTNCIAENFCTTDAPVWLDLGGRSLPAIGQQMAGRGCANWVGDCCNWEVPIIVRNCGDFFVYKLKPTPVCDLAFCATL